MEGGMACWLSFATYQTALSFLEYIEKSYDTDDAKILLKKKSREVYQKALSVCLDHYTNYIRNQIIWNRPFSSAKKIKRRLSQPI